MSRAIYNHMGPSALVVSEKAILHGYQTSTLEKDGNKVVEENPLLFCHAGRINPGSSSVLAFQSSDARRAIAPPTKHLHKGMFRLVVSIVCGIIGACHCLLVRLQAATCILLSQSNDAYLLGIQRIQVVFFINTETSETCLDKMSVQCVPKLAQLRSLGQARRLICLHTVLICINMRQRISTHTHTHTHTYIFTCRQYIERKL